MSYTKLVLLAPWLLIAVASSARADDDRSMQDRLDRVEHDLNQLQRQVYRSAVSGAPVTGQPPSAPEGGGSQALDAQIRVDQLETQIRTLTGQLEEVQYNNAQLTTRIEKMQSDNEVRFQQLENAPPPPGAVAPTAPPAKGKKPLAGPVPSPNNRGAGNMDQPAPSSGTLEAPQEAGPVASAAAPAPLAPATTTELPTGTSQAQYNYAFGLLRQADYQGAEAAFRVFLQKHPADPLAANAQYWLGETYFVRKDYTAAASAFAEGYQHFPQGAKAPDNLLKLGMALGNEGKKQEACFSFARLDRDFPGLSATLKDRTTEEKKRYGC